MSEFGEVPKEISEKGIGKASGVVGAGMEVVGPAVEAGAALATTIIGDAERIMLSPEPELGGAIPSVPSKLFEDEPLKSIVVQAPQSEVTSVRPLENIFNPKPVESIPVEAPVIEGGIK